VRKSSSSEHRIVDVEAPLVAARYRGLDHLLEGCQVVGHGWTYLYVNDALLAHARKSREELVGRTMMEVYPGIEATAVFARLRDCMHHRRSQSLENEFTYPDGERAWFELRVQPVPEGILVLSLDVSERRSGGEERERLAAQLRQSQKMEAIGRLAGALSHDFNNLLSVVLGYTDLALAGLAADDPRHGDLAEIRRAAESGAALTGQLLAFSRNQAQQLQPVDLNRVLAELEPMLRRLLGEDVELALRLAPELGMARADPHQIEQVVMNLAVNARDAMPEGGRLRIETADVELDEVFAARHADVEPGPHVLLTVSDSGHGMDAATLERIFEPFFTTKEAGKGTGLGLSTVWGIVKQSDGHVWVYSEPGRGTIFRLYFPRLAGDLLAAPRGGAPAPAARGGSERVLVVEDDEALRRLLTRILAAAGYEVSVAANGDEAWALAAAADEPVDLVVSDVVLPGVGGVELVARLREKFPRARALLMSGYTEEAIGGALAAGTAFLGKPFTAAELRARVRDLLDS
jgi:PAS domain S-box-containing protein